MDIELCIYYSDYLIPVNKPTTQCTYHHIQCTLQHTATLCIQCTSSAHTTAAIASSVHTATMYSHVQLSAANLQCTLQPSTTTYTTAIPSSAHYSYIIQCTLQPYYLVHTAATLSDANTIQCI